MNDSAYATQGNEFIPPQNSPGIYSFEVTQTVEGCESPGASVTLTIKESPLPPEGTDVSVCEGEPVPALTASGEIVKWYSDAGLSDLVHTGNEYQTGQSLPGTYSYFATQSLGDTIRLSIKPAPLSPSDTTVMACEGGLIPDLLIEGELIQWYNDEALQDLAYTGSHFATGISEAGTYTFYATKTMLECVSPASSVILEVGEIPLPPLTQSIEICEHNSNPELMAVGENIRWYTSEQFTDLIQSGTSFKPEFDSPGTYTYYVTQAVSHCQSPFNISSLTIKPSPEAPVTYGVSACEGEGIPEMEARGDSIRWYDTPALEDVIQMGSMLALELHYPGSYLFYATQTREGCEGDAEAVELIIHESPIISLGNDRAIRDDEELILGPYPMEFKYLWSDTSSEPFLHLDGEKAGPGDYEISVQVSNDQCVFRDTVIITVESTIGINPLNPHGNIKVYPNPTDDFITVEFAEELSENAFIEIIDSKGALVQQYRLKELVSVGDRSLKITLDTPGIYYLQIYNGDQVSHSKVIRY